MRNIKVGTKKRRNFYDSYKINLRKEFLKMWKTEEERKIKNFILITIQ